MSDAAKSNSLAILLVEDSEDDVFFFKRALQRSGVNASLSIARNGTVALEHLKAVLENRQSPAFPTPDVIFLDLKLPQFSGFDVLRWMGETSLLPKIPVVVLTGSDEERDRQLVESLGATQFLTKPIKIPDLVETLKNLRGTPPTGN